MSIGLAALGPVTVKTTDSRGFTPDELAEDVVNRIIYVADTAHPEIRQQAVAFRDRLHPLIRNAMQQAISSDRTTLAAQLREAGQYEAANIVGKF